jgi:hypothetical protein
MNHPLCGMVTFALSFPNMGCSVGSRWEVTQSLVLKRLGVTALYR